MAAITAATLPLLLDISARAAAVNGSWNLDVAGSWSTIANWTTSSPGVVPGGAGSAVGLTFNIATNHTLTIDTTSRTVGTLTIGDTNNTNTYALAASGGATLIFDNSGAGATLNHLSTGSGDSISAPIVLNDDLTITNSSVSAFAVTGGITSTGTNSLIFNANGTGNINLNATPLVNNSGTITVSGSNSAAQVLFGTTAGTGGVGSNVTNIFVTGNNAIGLRGSTLTNNGDVTLNGTGTGASLISAINVNNNGYIYNIGSTTGQTTISGNLGSAVKGVVQNSVSSLLLFQGDDTNFNGTFTLVTGTVKLGSATVLGGNGSATGAGGALILTGGTIDAVQTGITITTMNPENWNGNFSYGENGALNLGNGPVTLGQSVTVAFTGSNNSLFTVGGVIGEGTPGSGITKTGNGTFALANTANTYTGVTEIDGGLLNIASLAAHNTASSIGMGSSGGSAADLVIGGSTLQYNADTAPQTTDRLFTLGNASVNTGSLDSSSATPANTMSFTNSGAIALSASISTHTLTLTGSNTGANTFAPTLNNGAGPLALIKSGNGTWDITNAANGYTGITTISGGILNVAALAAHNVASSIGKGSSGGAASDWVFSGGTLQYTVATASTPTTTDRLFTIGSGLTATLDSSSPTVSNSMSFTGTGAISMSGASAHGLILTGSNTGANVFFPLITDAASTHVTTLTKNGIGAWQINNTNTYTGGTVVNGGTLTVSTAGTIGGAAGTLAVNNPNAASGTAVTLYLATGVNTTTGSLSGSIAAPSDGVNTATINNGGSGRTFTVNQTADASFAGAIAGLGSFTLGSSSTNTLTLTGISTYSGLTTISGGTLALNSSAGVLTGTSRINVGPAGKLSLTGAVATSTLLNTASLLSITDTGGTAPFVYLNLPATGGAGSGGVGTQSIFELVIDGTVQPAGLYGAMGSGAAFTSSDFSGTGEIIVAVPEPTSAALLGVAALVLHRRRRFRSV